MKEKWAYYLALAALAGAVAAFYMLAQYSSRGGEGAPLFSVFRQDPYGAAAFRELLAKSGRQAVPLQDHALPKASGGVLIQILARWEFSDPSTIRQIPETPGKEPVTEGVENPRKLLAWVREGNTLVVMARGVPEHMRSLGFAIKDKRVLGWVEKMERAQAKGTAPDKISGEPVLADWAASGEEGGMKLLIHSPVALKDKTGGKMTPIAWTKDGAVAMERKLGAGRVIMVGDPSPILNGWIEKGGNLEFVLSITGDGPVWFDEWSHGLSRGGSMIGLLERFGLIPALLQVMFTLALYVLAGRGLEAGEAPPGRERVSALEQVDALGRLYARTMKPAQARVRVARELYARVHGALRGGAGLGPDAIERAPEEKREKLKRALELAGRLENAGDEKISGKELAAALTYSRELTKEKTHG